MLYICNEKLEVDHFRALANGGTNDIANLQTLCKSHWKMKTKSEDGSYITIVDSESSFNNQLTEALINNDLAFVEKMSEIPKEIKEVENSKCKTQNYIRYDWTLKFSY